MPPRFIDHMAAEKEHLSRLPIFRLREFLQGSIKDLDAGLHILRSKAEVLE